LADPILTLLKTLKHFCSVLILFNSKSIFSNSSRTGLSAPGCLFFNCCKNVSTSSSSSEISWAYLEFDGLSLKGLIKPASSLKIFWSFRLRDSSIILVSRSKLTTILFSKDSKILLGDF
jgi:hypothetical protein